MDTVYWIHNEVAVLRSTAIELLSNGLSGDEHHALFVADRADGRGKEAWVTTNGDPAMLGVACTIEEAAEDLTEEPADVLAALQTVWPDTELALGAAEGG